ncbi:MAG: STAS domain-containing protein [Phycisphaeraceae bacterium]|nr:STAS domain-containing protein [Phycisphaeraceae bacterium]MBX3410167.1 STAS domain-containing protein [Phycisphaeraceae bacterium]
MTMIDNSYLSTQMHGDVLVVHLKCQKIGDFEATPVRTDVEKAAPSSRWRIVIDMSEVLLMTSPGIGVLVSLNKSANAAKGKVVLCGICDDLMGVLKVTALTKLFTIKKDVAEAIKAV